MSDKITATDLVWALRAAMTQAERALETSGATAVKYGEALEDLRAAVFELDEWMTEHGEDDFPDQWKDSVVSENTPPF